MATYFSLHTAKSFTSWGVGRNYYVFKAGTATKVEDAKDAQKFRNQRDVLYECDKNCKPANPAVNLKQKSKPLSKVTLDKKSNVVKKEVKTEDDKKKEKAPSKPKQAKSNKKKDG